MNKEKDIFIVGEQLSEKMESKYQKFTAQVFEFNFGDHKIQIEEKIAEECLKISKEKARDFFRGLCVQFMETCIEYKIPSRLLNTLILIDDEIDRALSSTRDIEGTLWGLILLSPRNLPPIGFEWPFCVLHELGHCWISAELPKNKTDLHFKELFMDLVAICSLRKVFPPHTKLYRDMVRYHSYLGREGQKVLGKEVQRRILEHPESFLQEFVSNLWKQGESE